MCEWYLDVGRNVDNDRFRKRMCERYLNIGRNDDNDRFENARVNGT